MLRKGSKTSCQDIVGDSGGPWWWCWVGTTSKNFNIYDILLLQHRPMPDRKLQQRGRDSRGWKPLVTWLMSVHPGPRAPTEDSFQTHFYLVSNTKMFILSLHPYQVSVQSFSAWARLKAGFSDWLLTCGHSKVFVQLVKQFFSLHSCQLFN